ncbi:regulation of nuclear pre-mRNA domain-containing protein 1B [Iris pallida]|uniref:Regulation of nuclear pre-mRNA domain-containing protein 1B n=1 Tax=Iris pallida TaxID=29817 RepID=A0AAX6HY75_IRIPA|nr:regulation of nuclear pre-mRNA domain-containing protein 1B [Iris pallida]
MNGNGIFNAQILVDKLAKLNSSQQSIETLSHWCIFHMKKASKLWKHGKDNFIALQGISEFLSVLANDILQNSRRKGLEFVSEFWKVLPNALNDVVQNGDESGRKAALRLVDIWDDRKVFGSRGQVLKEDLLANRNRHGRSITYKLKPSAGGDMLEKLISCYDHVNDGPVDEDVIFGKSRKAISFIEKLEEESGDEFNLGNIGGPGVLEELQGQHGFLRESIEQLKLAESSRSTLLLHLRERFLNRSSRLNKFVSTFRLAQSRYEQVEQLLIGQTVPPLPNNSLMKYRRHRHHHLPSPKFHPPPDYPPESPTRDMALSSPINYTQQHPQVSYVDTTSPHTTNEEHRKASAAEWQRSLQHQPPRPRCSATFSPPCPTTAALASQWMKTISVRW